MTIHDWGSFNSDVSDRELFSSLGEGMDSVKESPRSPSKKFSKGWSCQLWVKHLAQTDLEVCQTRGTPSYHPFKWDFPWKKPSSYGGTPTTMETPISSYRRHSQEHHQGCPGQRPSCRTLWIRPSTGPGILWGFYVGELHWRIRGSINLSWVLEVEKNMENWKRTFKFIVFLGKPVAIKVIAGHEDFQKMPFDGE